MTELWIIVVVVTIYACAYWHGRRDERSKQEFLRDWDDAQRPITDADRARLKAWSNSIKGS